MVLIFDPLKISLKLGHFEMGMERLLSLPIKADTFSDFIEGIAINNSSTFPVDTSSDNFSKGTTLVPPNSFHCSAGSSSTNVIKLNFSDLLIASLSLKPASPAP